MEIFADKFYTILLWNYSLSFGVLPENLSTTVVTSYQASTHLLYQYQIWNFQIRLEPGLLHMVAKNSVGNSGWI